MSKPFRIPSLEFYITNICNLTCDGCNRFNNYKFSGFERWKDHQNEYAEWAKILDCNFITILGGEPLLNPDFMQWAQGIKQLWPKSKLNITTNGYQLNKVKGFYDFLLNHKNTITVSISLHNKMTKSLIVDEVKKFLKPPIKFEFDNETPYQEILNATDANGIQIVLRFAWWFHQGALIKDPNTMKFTLHQSDVTRAHDICHSKYCHHFMHGKLYKCGPVALFPEFDKQLTLNLSDQDRALMQNYQPLTIDDSHQHKQEFLNNLPDSIPQCRFCPEEYHGKQIYGEEKKVVFERSIK